MSPSAAGCPSGPGSPSPTPSAWSTLVIGGLTLLALADEDFRRAVSDDGTVLVVLGALLLGGITGSLLQLAARLERTGAWLQRRLTKGDAGPARARFVEGYVSASLGWAARGSGTDRPRGRAAMTPVNGLPRLCSCDSIHLRTDRLC